MDQLNEKIAYLAGLAEGLDIDTSTKEGKLLKSIVEAMGEISDEIVGLQSDVADLEELVDEIDEDLGSVEEEVFSDELEDDYDVDEEDDDYFEITCPNCDEKIYLDGEMLTTEESITCPNCNEPIELEFDFGTDCCCDDCNHDH